MKKKNGNHLSSAEPEWLVGGGEMGKLVRAMDWSKTPLGPREQWPQSLRTTVSLCLNSNFPINMAWGPQAVQIYNDGYWPICGSKHPASMGQPFYESWASAWPAIGEAFESAARGEPAFLRNQRMFLDRHGYLEETFFTFSFSPIRDEAGHVGGLFHPVNELTDQMLGERRLGVLQALSNVIADSITVEEAIRKAVDELGSHPLDIPFAHFYRFDAAENKAHLQASSGMQAAASLECKPEQIDLQDDRCLWPIAEALQSGALTEVTDISEHASFACEPYPEPVEEAVLMPVRLNKDAPPLGVLVLGVSTRRRLDSTYRTFYAMLWNAVTKELSSVDAYARQRERTEALAELDRAKTAFFSNVSHELRTPLTLLLGPLEETLKSPRRPHAAIDRRRLETAHRNALRLMKLINSVLDFSRIEAGRAQAVYAPVDLPLMTRDLASMFRSAFEIAGVDFKVDCPEAPEPTYVDSGMWEKIILNLLSNAFKFTFEGRVHLSLHWVDKQIRLVVEDTGTGISQEELPRLFERFYRVPNARGRTFEGSGIGLALVRELVRLHGGTIDVTSTPKLGTRFTVAIPRGKAHLPPEQVTEDQLQIGRWARDAYVEEAMQWLEPQEKPALPMQAHADRAKNGRILVADDNADMRQYLYDLLSPYWQVETVSDGEQALQAIYRQEPDLLISDIMMPRLDGLGLLKSLRSRDTSRAMLVMLLSARAGEEARVQGLKAGADDYMVKPFSAKELVARVQGHIKSVIEQRNALKKAQHDPLTGLPNRLLGFEFMEQLIGAASRGKSQVAVLFIDMDRFKPINDQYGHAVGDAVLIEIGNRLKTCVRKEDVVARLGGDEFLACFSHIQSFEDAAQSARHMCQALAEPYHVEGLVLHTSPSIGVALYPEDGKTPEALTQAADEAMYRAKAPDAMNVQFYGKELNKGDKTASGIEARLKTAISNGEFVLHYQPVIDALTHQLTGLEALLRWPGSNLNPADFIPVAERCGIMDELGDWVIEEACHQLRAWQDEGLPPLTVSINISSVQLRQNRLIQSLVRSAAANGILPNSLQLEIKESQLSEANGGDALTLLGAIKAMGFKLSLDHFGSASTNFGDLARLAPNMLKMDRELSSKAVLDSEDSAVIAWIVSMGASLGLQVVAEGVEDAGVMATLKASRCQDFQGYHICRPIAANDFSVWYNAWRAT